MKKRNAGLGLALALVLTMGASAQTNSQWSNLAGGDFNLPTNWAPNVDPNGAGDLRFNNVVVTGDVVLSADVTANRIVAETGTTAMTLDLNGHSITNLQGSSVFGFSLNNVASSDISMVVKSSLPGSILEANHIRMGGAVSSTEKGNLTLTGSNLTVNITGTATDNQFFYAGSGTAIFSDGVTVNISNALLMGRSNGAGPAALATFFVTDPGTTFNMLGSGLNVGKGRGNLPTMIVSNGAMYAGSNKTAHFGQGGDKAVESDNNTNSNGRLIVTGSGSEFVTGTLTLGQHAGNLGTAGGYAYIVDSGKLSLLYDLSLGYGYANGNVAYPLNTDAYGMLVVSNANSVAVMRNLLIGTKGYGDVIVADNARLSVTNNPTGSYIQLADRSTLTISDALVETRSLTMASNSTLRLELGARDHAKAYVQLSSALTLDPNTMLDINFMDDFDYSGLGIGDKISLIKYGSVSGDFAGWTDFVTTVSSGGYEFLYNKIGGEIYLDVNAIPEPGTLGLIGAGLGLAALIRRRQG